MLYTKVES